jgi:hypothetical protein
MISSLGTRVAKMIKVNASKPKVGWKDEHPQSFGRLSTIIDKYFIDSV